MYNYTLINYSIIEKKKKQNWEYMQLQTVDIVCLTFYYYQLFIVAQNVLFPLIGLQSNRKLIIIITL